MKKIVLFTVGLLVTVMSFAQHRHATHGRYSSTRGSAYHSHAEFGLKAGLNIANYNDNAGSSDSRIGFHAGGLVHIHVDPHIAIQPEVVYSQQGAEFHNRKEKLDYVNIPLLLQYMFDQGLRIETGPQLGILASAKDHYNNGTVIDVKNGIKNTDFAWAFGLGYISHSGLGVDARYNVGLSDIPKNGADVQNHVWQIGLFYQFRD